MVTQIWNRLDSFLIILGFFLTAVFAYGHFIDGDVVQILDKAHVLATQGHVIPYGNVSSSGASGNIPGAFLTLSAGLPMLLWVNPWASLALLCLFHFFGLLMFRDLLKDFVQPITLTVLLVLFWLNPWRLSEVFLWNPGYIFLATMLHMWSAYHLSKKPSFWFSFLHGQSLFLGLQIHPSFIILFFITMMLLWTRALKPHLLGTFAGIIFGLLTLVPYFLEGIEHPHIFPQPGGGGGKGFLFFGLLYVYPLLKGFWYWILFGSNIFQTHVFHQTIFDWTGSASLDWLLKNLWTVIKYALGALGVILSFRVNFQFYKANKNKFSLWRFKMQSPDQWLAVYTICAFVAALMATAISPTEPIYWHLLYVWPMAIVPMLLAFDRWLKNEKTQARAKRYLLALIFYFSAANLFAGIHSKKHDLKKPFPELYQKVCQERCG